MFVIVLPEFINTELPDMRCVKVPVYTLFAHARNVSVHHRKIVRCTSQAYTLSSELSVLPAACTRFAGSAHQ